MNESTNEWMNECMINEDLFPVFGFIKVSQELQY